MKSASADLYKVVTYRQEFLCREDLPHILHSSYAIDNFPFAERLDLFAVVEPGVKALFFDVGKPELCGTEALDSVLATYQIPWESAEIVISHFHDDHDGCLEYCVEQGVRCIYHGPHLSYSDELKHNFLVRTGIEFHGETDALGAYADFFFAKNRFSEQVERCMQEVAEGKVFHIAEYDLQVSYTPGHTYEHISLFEPNKRILFAGDFILDTVPGVMEFVPETNMVGQYLQNLEMARKLNLKALFMSHHDVLFSTEAVNALIDKQIASYRHPLEKTTAQFAVGEWLDAYEVSMRYCGSGKGNLRALDDNHRIRKIAILYGYLDYLVQRGVLQRKLAQDGRELFSLRSAGV